MAAAHIGHGSHVVAITCPEGKVAELERDKQELKAERDEYKRRYKSATD